MCYSGVSPLTRVAERYSRVHWPGKVRSLPVNASVRPARSPGTRRRPVEEAIVLGRTRRARTRRRAARLLLVEDPPTIDDRHTMPDRSRCGSTSETRPNRSAPTVKRHNPERDNGSCRLGDAEVARTGRVPRPDVGTLRSPPTSPTDRRVGEPSAAKLLQWQVADQRIYIRRRFGLVQRSLGQPHDLVSGGGDNPTGTRGRACASRVFAPSFGATTDRIL
jgi:hypothetical protein